MRLIKNRRELLNLIISPHLFPLTVILLLTFIIYREGILELGFVIFFLWFALTDRCTEGTLLPIFRTLTI